MLEAKSFNSRQEPFHVIPLGLISSLFTLESRQTGKQE